MAENKETILFRHSSGTAHMSSHPLGHYAQDCMLEPDSMEKGGRHEISPLIVELLATDSCWSNQFSLMGWPLVD